LTSELKYCRNCGAPVTNKYCQNCGQRASVYKVTFIETFNDLTENMLRLDAPFPLTLKMLVLNPGLLFREYLGGKRKKYYRPISFFILATLIYLFVRWVIDFEDYLEISIGTMENRIDLELFSQARDYMFQNIKSMAFILVFTMALSIKLFLRDKYSIPEYIAVSFYLNGFYSLLATLNLFFIQYVNSRIQYLAMVVMCAYFIYAMISFFQNKPLLAGIKSFLSYWMAYGAYIAIAFGVSYLLLMFDLL